jgi:hypothetical protein
MAEQAAPGAGQKRAAQMAAGISAFRTDLGRPALSGYVIHPGDVRLPLGLDAIALPFRGL